MRIRVDKSEIGRHFHAGDFAETCLFVLNIPTVVCFLFLDHTGISAYGLFLVRRKKGQNTVGISHHPLGSHIVDAVIQHVVHLT